MRRDQSGNHVAAPDRPTLMRWVLLVSIVAILAVGCDPGPVSIASDPDAPQNTFTVGTAVPVTSPPSSLSPYQGRPTFSARSEWESLDISDYDIVYSITNLNGMGGSGRDGIHHVEVRDGVITQCRLDHEVNVRCDPRVTSPVDDLYFWVDQFDPVFTEVVYHPEWHIPARINYDDPGDVDEEYVIRLLELEPVRPPT